MGRRTLGLLLLGVHLGTLLWAVIDGILDRQEVTSWLVVIIVECLLALWIALHFWLKQRSSKAHYHAVAQGNSSLAPLEKAVHTLQVAAHWTLVLFAVVYSVISLTQISSFASKWGTGRGSASTGSVARSGQWNLFMAARLAGSLVLLALDLLSRFVTVTKAALVET